jgi:UDP-N-acetylglucosamine--N-acetylmuramyl-(pentapeptide) pyrophosphoryl-undecaprenol N-acetylglucosamine transferase
VTDLSPLIAASGQATQRGIVMARPTTRVAVAVMPNPPIVIAAGGTGGHFFPAEALAEELIRRGHRVTLMTDARSAGLRSSVFAGHARHVLRGGGLAGHGVRGKLRGLWGLMLGTLQARRLMRRDPPAAVVGFGGYPAVAPVLAASRRRTAIILHEQNGVLGRANRLLVRRGAHLALSLEATTRVPSGARTTVTGNPVRAGVLVLEDEPYAPPTDRIALLVLGGSLGARVFSDVVPAALAALPDPLRRRLSVVQQCRAEDLDRVRDAYAAGGIDAELDVFFANIADRLAAAHLVITRAGASTVAELAVAGRPTLLVPLPGAIDDHQTANARALAATGGAWIMPQPTFTAPALSARLTTLLSDPATLATAALAIRAAARPDAATRLADLVEARIDQETRS